MDNYERVASELQTTKQKLAEANRRFDEAMKTINLQSMVIRDIASPKQDDLTFLMDTTDQSQASNANTQ